MRHEAAHFLAGYLCGLPIKSYKADGGTTLVEFYDSVEGDMGGRALKFTPEEVDQVSRLVFVAVVCTTCLWILIVVAAIVVDYREKNDGRFLFCCPPHIYIYITHGNVFFPVPCYCCCCAE